MQRPIRLRALFGYFASTLAVWRLSHRSAVRTNNQARLRWLAGDTDYDLYGGGGKPSKPPSVNPAQSAAEYSGLWTLLYAFGSWRRHRRASSAALNPRSKGTLMRKALYAGGGLVALLAAGIGAVAVTITQVTPPDQQQPDPKPRRRGGTVQRLFDPCS